MNDKPIARLTGVAYLALAIAGGASFLAVRGALYVAGDPAATAANLAERTGLAHLGLALDVVTVVGQALAALGFYALFRRERPVAAFGVAAFGLANAIVITLAAAFNATALTAASESATIVGGDPAATAGLMYALSGACWLFGNIFFGLWLIPMGWFVVSTRRFPKVMGWFLIAGGVGYVLSAFLGALAPDHSATIGNLLPLPATVGELWILAYLLVLGIRPAVSSSTTAAA